MSEIEIPACFYKTIRRHVHSGYNVYFCHFVKKIVVISLLSRIFKANLKETGGVNYFVVDQPSPFVLHWLLRHLVVRFAWKIPSS